MCAYILCLLKVRIESFQLVYVDKVLILGVFALKYSCAMLGYVNQVFLLKHLVLTRALIKVRGLMNEQRAEFFSQVLLAPIQVDQHSIRICTLTL